jgi:hypothetical protein
VIYRQNRQNNRKKIGDLSRFSARLSFRYIVINRQSFRDFEDMAIFYKKPKLKSSTCWTNLFVLGINKPWGMLSLIEIYSFVETSKQSLLIKKSVSKY